MTSYDELSTLDKAATQGPWKTYKSGGTIYIGEEQRIGWAMKSKDSFLIIAMRNALPGMLDNLEETEDLRERLSKVREIAESLFDATSTGEHANDIAQELLDVSDVGE